MRVQGWFTPELKKENQIELVREDLIDNLHRRDKSCLMERSLQKMHLENNLIQPFLKIEDHLFLKIDHLLQKIGGLLFLKIGGLLFLKIEDHLFQKIEDLIKIKVNFLIEDQAANLEILRSRFQMIAERTMGSNLNLELLENLEETENEYLIFL